MKSTPSSPECRKNDEHVEGIRDGITTAKIAEDALHKNEELYRTTIEAAIDGYCRIDMNGRILEVNDAHCQLFGYARAEMLGMKISNMEVSYNPEQVAIHLHNIMESGSDRFETKLRTKDGRILDVEISALYSEKAGPGFLAFARDITDRKRAEEWEHHLINLLLTVRNVNKLLIHEDDTKILIEKACFNLTETLCYSNAWIVLLNTDGSVMATAESGIDEKFAAIQEQLYSGKSPFCVDSVLKHEGIVVIDQQNPNCDGCPLSDEYAGMTEMACRLSFDERVYGVLVVSMPDYFVQDEEEQDIFAEIGNDLGYALHKIDAENALRESEQKYRTLADNGRILIWTSGKDKLCDYFNLPWLQFTGHTMEQELGNGWAESVHPDDVENCIKVYTEAFDRREMFTREYRLRRYDDEYRWILDDGSPRYDSKGQFIGYIGHCLDITERKDTEMELSDSEQKFKSLYNNAPLSYQSLNEDGCLINVNPTWLKMLGYEREEVIGKSFAHFLHIDWKPHFEKNFPEFKRRGYVHDVQFRMRHKDGHYMYVSFEGCIGYYPDGSFKQTYCVFKDITAQKYAEDKLAEEAVRRRIFIEQSRDGIFVFDENGKICEANLGFANMIGYPLQEIIRMNLWDIDILWTREQLLETIQNMEGGHIETIYRCKDGTVLDVEVSADKVLVGGQSLTFCVCRDSTERKQAEEEMEKYKQIVSSTPDGISLVDKNYRYSIVNDAYELFSDKKREELIGLTVAEYLGDELFYDEIKDHFDRCLKGETIRYQTWVQYPKLGERFVDVTYSPYINKNGKIAGVVANTRDITGMKLDEEALRALAETSLITDENIFNFLARKLAVSQGTKYALIARIDDEQKIAHTVAVWIDGTYAENFSYSLEDTPCNDVITGDQCFYFSDIQKLFPRDHLLKEMGAESYWGTPLKNSHGKIIGLLALIDNKPMKKRSQTSTLLNSFAARVAAEMERQHSEEALKESEEKLSVAMETSEYGFWDIDLDNKTVYMSPTTYTIYGYDMEELPPTLEELLSFIHPNDKEMFLENIESSIRQIIPFHLNVRIKNRSGELVWLSLKGKPVDIDESGKVHHLIGTQVDITPWVKAEKALLYARAAADESNRMKSELLKNITHELRTPLTAVIGFSELMLSEDMEKDENRFKEYIRYINQGGKDLLIIVNRILDFTNLENGLMGPLQLQSINIEDMISEIQSSLLTKAVKKNIKMTAEIDPDLEDIVADKNKFKDILYNLVENAIKFTHEEGSINVEANRVNGAFLFSVHDTGIGIEKEKIKKIFEPFVQMDGSLSRKFGGTGLGLALVKKLVEMHDGHIRVESETGKGSTFIFEIPVDLGE